MVKNILALVLLVLFCMLAGSTAEALCTKTARANLRAGPGTHYSLVWEVYRYMPFEKVGKSLSGTWHAVRDVDGDVSWIHGSLVTDSYLCAVVKKSGTNVRTGPSTGYREAKWGPAKQYDSFRVLKRRGSWVRVKDEWGNTGWIYKNLLWVR